MWVLIRFVGTIAIAQRDRAQLCIRQFWSPKSPGVSPVWPPKNQMKNKSYLSSYLFDIVFLFFLGVVVVIFCLFWGPDLKVLRTYSSSALGNHFFFFFKWQRHPSSLGHWESIPNVLQPRWFCAWAWQVMPDSVVLGATRELEGCIWWCLEVLCCQELNLAPCMCRTCASVLWAVSSSSLLFLYVTYLAGWSWLGKTVCDDF